MSTLPAHPLAQFERTGVLCASGACPLTHLDFLGAQQRRLRAQPGRRRSWHYHELHNPWSPAATVYDSWGFLDLCQAPALVGQVAQLLGPDFILYDSQWLPDSGDNIAPRAPLGSDVHRFPVEPLAGLTVVLPLATAGTSATCLRYLAGSHRTGGSTVAGELPLTPGDVVLLDARLQYRLDCPAADSPSAFAIRYFPASSRYLRDPNAPMHRDLTRRYPLINYARLPLWLVHGEDRADNDFVTGFGTRAGFWTQATQ